MLRSTTLSLFCSSSKNVLAIAQNQNLFVFKRLLSVSSSVCEKFHVSEPKKWLKYNDKVYPPQSLDEKPRPAYVCHMKCNIKHSPKKMWYVAVLIRGLRLEEAINQLKFVDKKGAIAVGETLEEAKELAIKEHNVEFTSNLWVAESFVGRALTIKGIRRHAKKRMGLIHYRYCHYFVRLEEGDPPENYYYWSRPLSPEEKIKDWLKEKRERTILLTL